MSCVTFYLISSFYQVIFWPQLWSYSTTMRRPHDGATLSTSRFTVRLHSGFRKTKDGAVSKTASTILSMFVVRVEYPPSFLICCSRTQRHTETRERYLAAQSWRGRSERCSGQLPSQEQVRAELTLACLCGEQQTC